MNQTFTINKKQITLGPWKGYGVGKFRWNFYRVSHSEQIGFVVENAEIFKKDPNLAKWKIDTSFSTSLMPVINIFIRMYGEEFNYSELRKAKSNLDILLSKFDDLKLYL